MVCFDHEDVIFLLNRWDTFLDDDEKDAYFESIKERLRSIWEEVEETRILKLSMNKACNYGLSFTKTLQYNKSISSFV